LFSLNYYWGSVSIPCDNLGFNCTVPLPRSSILMV
jgi:hypothetical protein